MNVCYNSKIVPKGKRCITLGGTISCRTSSIQPSLLAHEISHGSQWAVPGFVKAYAAGALYEAVTGRCNPMEKGANYGERHGC